MMPKYNLALIPIHHAKKFVAFAKKLSSEVKNIGEYHISQHSIPHVTLLHFEAEENEVKFMWDKLQNLSQPKSIELTFKILHKGPHNRLYWYLLLPNKVELLQQMRINALTIFKKKEDSCYFPHLTLFNTDDTTLFSEEIKLQNPLISQFAMALTDRDAVGQSLKIIYQSSIV